MLHIRFDIIRQMEKLPAQQYEFPNGYRQDFGSERYRIAECLFDPSYLKNLNNPNPYMSISNSVVNSINMCDIDLRP
uniref:Uncharacterized protein n=1 Tax=Romanomermis culicivorax TaxID=13658 RepID=A0A915J4Q6_ROMCU